MKQSPISYLFPLTVALLLFALQDFSYGIVKETQVVQDLNNIYTPHPKTKPRINGPLVYGCRPGHPFLYRIPCQGKRPISFIVEGLPPELKYDPSTGIISGKAPEKGDYDILILARNSKGTNLRKLKIVAGDQIALTPPMGWNHWYAHYDRITDKMMREAADLMIKSGMVDVG
ncbi:MAG TPA: hypothetical protein VGK10_18000, partial [Prolixibacteraceae bacterium]